LSVYVDRLAPCVPTAKWRFTKSAHLIADDVEELHEFAARLGMKREWFQPESSPHYDLNSTRHAKAIELGAKLLERREFVAVIIRLRQERVGSKS
jgi:hypothetical protein